jgi:alpha-tubulin suppressor-like RCC1 family protein
MVTLHRDVGQGEGGGRHRPVTGRRLPWGTTAIIGTTLTIAACGTDQDPVEPPPPAVSTVTVSPAVVSLLPGETRALSAVARNAAGETVAGTPSWSTSAPGVASVSATGVVTALTPGQATVTATIGGRSGTAVVNVEVPTATLTVVVGSGVISSLPAGSATYPVGTELSYSFTARPGFETPVAWLDSNPTPLSGVVTVDRDLNLVAMADSVLLIPPEDEPLVERLRAFRTTADPGAAWLALQAEIAQMYQVVGAVGARERLLRAVAVALDPVTDAGPLWRAMQAGLDMGPPSGVAGDPLGVAVSPCPSLPTIGTGAEIAFIYVNGIDTDLSEACTTALDHLKPILDNAGFGDAVRFPKLLVYNNSAKHVDGSPVMCAFLSGIKALWKRDVSFLDEAQACPGKFGDLAEAAYQIFNAGPPIEDSRSLAAVIEQVWSQGARAIIVAHSQGNLLTSEALEILRPKVPPVAMTCVGVASIAPPATVIRPPPEFPARDMIIRGTGTTNLFGHLVRSEDVLLVVLPLLGLGDAIAGVVRLSTDQSDYLDRYLAGRIIFSGSIAALNLRFAAGVVLHSINDSYLTSEATVTRLKAMVAAQVTAVTNGCPVPPGAAPTITGVTPTPVVGSGTAQTITVAGTGFQQGATVTLVNTSASQTFAGLPPATVSPTQLTVSHVFPLPAATWTVQVVQGGGVASNAFPFQVVAPPLPPPGGVVPQTITAGFDHTCGLTTTGAAYCWGLGEEGRLGTGSTASTAVPALVAGGLAFAAITAGEAHTCALTPAGAAFCWGGGGGGRLGNGSTTDRTAAAAVAGGHTFVAIAAGGAHTCAITGMGTAFCWGSGSAGALGNGGTSDRTGPAAVAGNHSFVAITAGFSHTCGITIAGTTYCWGAGLFGQLGDGTSTDRTSPIAVAGGHSFARVTAGAYHTCGVTQAGSGYCWGAGSLSELGTGTSTDRAQPTSVAGNHQFTAITAGGNHTCGVTAAGAALCWGAGGFGQIGDGALTPRPTPATVAGGHLLAALAAGADHTCGITTSGAAYCWGHGLSGQLGNGSSTHQSTPALVSGGLTFGTASGGAGSGSPTGIRGQDQTCVEQVGCLSGPAPRPYDPPGR